jgi:hypothetical protein
LGDRRPALADGNQRSNLAFYPLSRKDAESIVRWHYEDEYSVYDRPVDQRASGVENMLDSKNRFFGVYRDAE